MEVEEDLTYHFLKQSADSDRFRIHFDSLMQSGTSDSSLDHF